MTNIKHLSNIDCFDPTITCGHINSFTQPQPLIPWSIMKMIHIFFSLIKSERNFNCFCAQSEYLFPYKTWGETVVGSQSGEST